MAEEDSPAVARLCIHLGYPVLKEQVRQRFRVLNGAENHKLLVAQDDSENVVGWVHVHVTRLLQTAPVAEIWALVVDKARRGEGVGRLLMAEAERWAAKEGCCSEARLRSNVVRKDAHRFYEGVGYRVLATSLVLHKALAEDCMGGS